MPSFWDLFPASSWPVQPFTLPPDPMQQFHRAQETATRRDAMPTVPAFGWAPASAAPSGSPTYPGGHDWSTSLGASPDADVPDPARTARLAEDARRDAPLTREQAVQLRDVGSRYGLPDLVDRGNGVTMTNFMDTPSGVATGTALRRSDLPREIRDAGLAADAARWICVAAGNTGRAGRLGASNARAERARRLTRQRVDLAGGGTCRRILTVRRTRSCARRAGAAAASQDALASGRVQLPSLLLPGVAIPTSRLATTDNADRRARGRAGEHRQFVIVIGRLAIRQAALRVVLQDHAAPRVCGQDEPARREE